MAGDWIKIRSNLWDDPRIARLCDLTGRGEAEIIGALYWLWASADQHSEDGVMPGLSIRQIDRKTGVPGFGQALCDIEWLADHPEGVRIIRFEEHNGASAKRRAVEAKRKAEARNVSALDADKTRTKTGHRAELEKELEKEKEQDQKTPPKAPQGGDDEEAEQPDPFEQAWSEYPKRAGGNSKKSALKAWTARIRAGATPDDLIAGVRRYAKYCDATGKLNTEFVKQAATFFGPDEHYLLDWSPPANLSGKRQQGSFSNLDYDDGVNADGTFG